MISVDEAARIIRSQWPDFGQTELSILNPTSGLLTRAFIGDRSYPPIHRVMMDGIAVSFETYHAGLRKFKIEGMAAAGMAEKSLPDPNSCLEIMTGAALPKGASLVIPYEHLKISDGFAEVTLEQTREHFDNIHELGSDFQTGDTLLAAGQVLNGPAWGIAASVGTSTPKVLRKPKIKIISTGDELVSVNEAPLPHQIRRSNAHALHASLLSRGFTDVSLDHVNDNYESLLSHYEKASSENDVLIYSGGVSKGKFDYLPEVWKAKGVEKQFHEVAQRPGKPLYFGVDRARNIAIFGLPGNPISSLVCLYRYFFGAACGERAKYARLTHNIEFARPLAYFVPIKIEYAPDGCIYATLTEVKNSGEFAGLAGSDGMIELPANLKEFKKGESFRFFEWGSYI